MAKKAASVSHLQLIKNPIQGGAAAAENLHRSAGSLRFLTRQPILDAGYRLIGYEFGVHNNVPVPAVPGAENLQQMRDEWLLASVRTSGLQQALGDRYLSFLTVEAATLGKLPLQQLPASMVLVPRDLAALSEAGRNRLLDLASLGVRLALNDSDSEAAAKLPAALWRYVRIDVNQSDALGLAQRYDRARAQYPAARIVATAVDTDEAFRVCKKSGFQLFQGYHLSQLQPATAHRLHGSRVRIMELLNEVMVGAEIAAVEAKFKTDAGLSYKLLRYLNSPALMLNQPIQSIGHALMYLGHEQLYRWLTLLLFAGGEADARSLALLRNAVVRARFVENLGQGQIQLAQRGSLFIVGMLSLLHALLNLPMAKAIDGLSLPQEVADGLLHGRGPFAAYLQLAEACESFDQNAVQAYAEAIGRSAEEVNLAHVEALIWAEELLA
ncbi:MAG: HDOD domain-containing protein [Hydrogenophilaceae bacterium]|nr:HDOD domain-containing protein [Hydrogenophilaceae bacterium]